VCSDSFDSQLIAIVRNRDPKVYLGAVKHLSLEPHNCAMVAAHVYDLRAAASVGMRTVYIPRAGEEFQGVGEVKSKADGGDIDVVVQSFAELAALLAQRK
jgi:beta-phosphoglucomutase-like phosphatase (HAD superfamily)